MIYTSKVTGVKYLDHDPGCGIFNPTDRACTCTVVFPFPNPAGNWDGWMTLTHEEQQARLKEYRDNIRAEVNAFIERNGRK